MLAVDVMKTALGGRLMFVDETSQTFNNIKIDILRSNHLFFLGSVRKALT